MKPIFLVQLSGFGLSRLYGQAAIKQAKNHKQKKINKMKLFILKSFLIELCCFGDHFDGFTMSLKRHCFDWHIVLQIQNTFKVISISDLLWRLCSIRIRSFITDRFHSTIQSEIHDFISDSNRN